MKKDVVVKGATVSNSSNNNSTNNAINSPSSSSSSSPALVPSQLFVHDLSLYKELVECISIPEDYYEAEESTTCSENHYPPQQHDATPSSLHSDQKLTSKSNKNKIVTREEKEKLEHKREAKRQETEAFFQKIKETTTKLRNKRHEESEKRFQDLWNDILEERETFLKDLNEKLASYHEGDERKRQQIYEEWCEKVFDPIQNQIDEHLSKLPFEEIKRKKRLKFEEYLNKLNHKHKNNGGVFRDIVLEDEYDPFELSKDTFKYKTTTKKKIGEVPSKPSLGLRKQDMLDVAQYDKLGATPFGHYSKMIHPNSNSSKLASK